jgi:hypothetical protein
MGKRTNFPRNARDLYPTPAKAVLPLLPYLRGVRTFAEPCCGEGDLIRHLQSHGLRCVYQGDIATGQDARRLTAAMCRGGEIITNPPFRRPDDPKRTTRLMRDLIRRFLDIGVPSWLLLPADFMFNENFAPFRPHCTDIVAIGRVKWIADSEHDGGFENSAWYHFAARHVSGPVFHNDRGRVPTVTAARSQACAVCGRAHTRQRTTRRFCSDACRQAAYRQRLSVTINVTESAP